MSRRSRLVQIVALAFSLCAPAAHGADQQWIRVSSEHFTVLTDAGEKRGREVLLRFEQMRAMFAELLLKTRVNLSEPLEIIAFKSDKEYAQVAPKGAATVEPGFYLPGEDRNYIVLNLFEDDSWRPTSRQFALMLLKYNYPPTQTWFDAGFADYFSSMHLDNKQVQIGEDPSVAAQPANQLVAPRQIDRAPKTFTELLHVPVWLAIPDLFSSQRDPWSAENASHRTLYDAESWIVMHYLINSNKLSETGNYFQSVELENLPVDQAIQKAYGIAAAQLERAVQDYFKALEPQFAGEPPTNAKNASVFAVHAYPSPVPADTMGASSKPVLEPVARAAVAEMAARMPQHREQAIGQLQAVVADPKTDNAVAHRALAWIAMEKNDYEHAIEELDSAAQLDASDPWVRYELALVKYHRAQGSGGQLQGLANMMQDLRAVLDWNPEFAEAYHLLALARVEGGGNNSAMEAERAAMLLSPRNQSYILGMANIYIALKQWDAATATLQRLKTSSDPQIQRAARKKLDALPLIKKYGFEPEETEASHPSAQPSSRQARLEPEGRDNPSAREGDKSENSSSSDSGGTPASSAPDRRQVQFVKGKIVSVDCSNAPAAVITVTSGARKLRFRTSDYKSLLLIGADQFSCDWKNVNVAVNYKSGKAVGDLVSLEIQ